MIRRLMLSFNSFDWSRIEGDHPILVLIHRGAYGGQPKNPLGDRLFIDAFALLIEVLD